MRSSVFQDSTSVIYWLYNDSYLSDLIFSAHTLLSSTSDNQQPVLTICFPVYNYRQESWMPSKLLQAIVLPNILQLCDFVIIFPYSDIGFLIVCCPNTHPISHISSFQIIAPHFQWPISILMSATVINKSPNLSGLIQ